MDKKAHIDARRDIHAQTDRHKDVKPDIHTGNAKRQIHTGMHICRNTNNLTYKHAHTIQFVSVAQV